MYIAFQRHISCCHIYGNNIKSRCHSWFCFGTHMQCFGSIKPFSILTLWLIFAKLQPYLFSDMSNICTVTQVYRLNIHACTYIYIHRHSCMCAYLPTYLHAYQYMHACTHTCMHALTETYIHAYRLMFVYLHMNMQTYMQYPYSCLATYIHTHTYSCMHDRLVCLHTYMHT